MKSNEDIIIEMLDSLAYELISAYHDVFPIHDCTDFLDYIENIYNQVEEDKKDGKI